MDTYPAGTVRALLNTGATTEPTRVALEGRYHTATPALQFFTMLQMATLRAAAARLVPQRENSAPVDIAAEIDGRLTNGLGNGWRFASLPADEHAYQRGLTGLEETAQGTFGASFVALRSEEQDEVLLRVQSGTAEGETWQSLDSARFFEELLADLAEAYYSHPLAQEEIGYVGMADARGWSRIGLDQLEDREPLPLRPPV